MSVRRHSVVSTIAIALVALVAQACATGQTSGAKQPTDDDPEQSETSDQERFVANLKRHLEQVPEPDGQRIEGRRHGTWTFYFPDGQPRARGEFKRGRRVGEWRYFMPDGSPLVDIDYAGPQFGAADRDYRVDVTDDSVAKEGWPASFIALELNSHDPSIQHCYERLLKEDPEKSGVMTLRFTINRPATVDALEFVRLDQPLDTPAFRGCIKAVFSEMQYLPVRAELSLVKTYHLDVVE